MEENNLIEKEIRTCTNSCYRDDGKVSQENSLLGLEDRVHRIKTRHRELRWNSVSHEIHSTHGEPWVQSPAPPKPDLGCMPVLLGLERCKWEEPESQVMMPASGL